MTTYNVKALFSDFTSNSLLLISERLNISVVATKIKKLIHFSDSSVNLDKSGFGIIMVNGGFLDIVTMQTYYRNSHMNARCYSAPSYSIKELYLVYKNTHLYFKVQDIVSLSLIEKLIASTIVCEA